MLYIVIEKEREMSLLKKLKKFGLEKYEIVNDQKKLVNPEGVLYCDSQLLNFYDMELNYDKIRVPALWFPGRILLSKEEWIRSYELGLEFVPGTDDIMEILLVRLRSILYSNRDATDDEDKEDVFLNTIYNYLEKHHLDKDFSIEKMGLDLGMSRTNFFSKLKDATGISPSRLVMQFRLKKAEGLLRRQAGNISDVAYEVGFSSTAYFAKCFKEFFGKRPSDFMVKLELSN